jgi:phenylalanyl-tRNA synthetase alpha chain
MTTTHLPTQCPDISLLTPDQLAAALAVPDLTAPDPVHGPHAIRLMAEAIVAAVGAHVETCWISGHPLVPVEDNYERLGYPADAVTRAARYTRYASPTCMLRSHSTAMVPGALRELAADWYAPGREGTPRTVLLACAGMAYRRDQIDRLHTGTPHQLDLWRVAARGRLGLPELEEMAAAVVAAALPGARHRLVPTRHPYTLSGRQIDVYWNGEWVEIGECGVAAPRVLAGAGLGPRVGGLAAGLGLDRLVMLRKNVPDIRLLRSDDERVATQLRDLAPYRPVSRQPPVVRDVSVAVDARDDDETLGALVREALGADVDTVDEIRVLTRTPVERLPAAAVTRLGAAPGQVNVLLRVVLRHPTRTLSDSEANALRDRVYAATHQGSAPLSVEPPARNGVPDVTPRT